MNYAIVENGVPRPYTYKQLKNDNPNVSFPRETLTNERLLEYNIYPIVENTPIVAENEEATPDALVFTGTTVEQNYTVTEVMPIAEWNAQQATQADEGILFNKILKLAFIQTELIDQLLADNTISATDFTPAVRQEYLDIKAAVDRLKA